jgi:hypothetical protein
MAYFCDYMSFLLSLQQKIMLCMKQEKTIYKGYFTYQANIIGYATYKLNKLFTGHFQVVYESFSSCFRFVFKLQGDDF